MSMEIAVILIAAGASRRFGEEDKLNADYNGEPLLAHAAETLSALPVSAKILVLRPQSTLYNLPQAASFTPVFNENAEAGMGTSIAKGIAAGLTAAPLCDAALIALADMPDIAPATLAQLLHAAETSAKGIMLPVNENGDGHPVLFARQYFDDLMKLNADMGGRAIIDANPDDVLRLNVKDPGIHFDIDRPSDLQSRHD